MPAAAMTDAVIGRFRLTALIARGGMGEIYAAREERTGTPAAVKFLPPQFHGHDGAHARFEREVRASQAAQDPGVVRVLDAGEADGRLYLAMELIDGMTVEEAMADYEANTPKRMPYGAATEMVRQAAETMQRLHDRGLVHRDLKPENLMISRDGRVKVLDLGIARLEEATVALTRSRDMIGTVDFMAPEQALDSRACDHRADVYGLGATLYRIVTARLPYPHERYPTLMKKLAALGTVSPERVLSIRPNCPPRLAHIIDRATQFDPDRRTPTAGELAEQLREFARPASFRTFARRMPARPRLSGGSPSDTDPDPPNGGGDTTPTAESRGVSFATILTKAPKSERPPAGRSRRRRRRNRGAAPAVALAGLIALLALAAFLLTGGG